MCLRYILGICREIGMVGGDGTKIENVRLSKDMSFYGSPCDSE